MRRSELIAAIALLLVQGCVRVPTSTGKVVSLVPSVTEIIYALGQERQLAGNTTFCNYPAQARDVYKVGDFSNPSVERILALKPRLVFATLPEQQTTVERLKQMGIRVFVSRPVNLDSMLQEILRIGQELGVAARAETLVSGMKERLGRIPVPSLKPRVYLEISEQPLMSVGAGSFIAEAVVRAGGENIFGAVRKEYPEVSQEQVIARNPEIIIILHPQSKAKDVALRLGWQNVAAVKAGRIYDDVDPDLLLRSGPRIIDGIEALAKRFQPQ